MKNLGLILGLTALISLTGPRLDPETAPVADSAEFDSPASELSSTATPTPATASDCNLLRADGTPTMVELLRARLRTIVRELEDADGDDVDAGTLLQLEGSLIESLLGGPLPDSFELRSSQPGDGSSGITDWHEEELSTYCYRLFYKQCVASIRIHRSEAKEVFELWELVARQQVDATMLSNDAASDQQPQGLTTVQIGTRDGGTTCEWSTVIDINSAANLQVATPSCVHDVACWRLMEGTGTSLLVRGSVTMPPKGTALDAYCRIATKGGRSSHTIQIRGQSASRLRLLDEQVTCTRTNTGWHGKVDFELPLEPSDQSLAVSLTPQQPSHLQWEFVTIGPHKHRLMLRGTGNEQPPGGAVRLRVMDEAIAHTVPIGSR